MPTNDFLQFAEAGGANVLTQAAWAALAELPTGFTSGILPSTYLNKALRQHATIAAVIGDLIVTQTGEDAVDDGTTATLLTNLTSAIRSVSGGSTVVLDCSSSSVTFSLPLAGSAGGAPIHVQVVRTDSSGHTLQVETAGSDTALLFSSPLLISGPGQAAFTSDGVSRWFLTGSQTGSYAALNGSATEVFNVANAATATEAVAFGQLAVSARCLRFTTSGTFTVGAGITSIRVSGCGGGAGGDSNYSGGAGKPTLYQMLSVTPGHALAINIGSAGAIASPGGDTTIVDTTTSTTLLTLEGALFTGGGLFGYPTGGGRGSVDTAAVGASGPFGGGGHGGSNILGGPGGDAYGFGAGGGGGVGWPGGAGAPGIIFLEF